MNSPGRKKSLFRRITSFFVMVAMVFALSLPASKKANAFCLCALLPGCDLCCGCSTVIEVAFVEVTLALIYRQFRLGSIVELPGLGSVGFGVGWGEAMPIQYDNPGDDGRAESPKFEWDDSENTEGPGGTTSFTIMHYLQNLYIHVLFKGDPLKILSILPEWLQGPMESVFEEAIGLIEEALSAIYEAVPGGGGSVQLDRYGFLPAMQDMSEEIMQVMFKHTAAVGYFLDAENQLRTQRLFQELAADAHQRYKPDVAMCIVGTQMRSVASSDSNSDMTMIELSKRARDRELNADNAISSEGRDLDRASRLRSFATTFCDPRDNNPAMGIPGTGFELVCGDTSPENYNKDIDYMGTMLVPETLSIDFEERPPTVDEEAIFGMSNYLYAHDVFDPVTEAVLDNPESIDEYLDLRSVVAKRSVARASFEALAGLKTQGRPTLPDSGSSNPAVVGSDRTREYMAALFSELGMEPDEVWEIMGERPSYYAQMKMLSKLIYQRPKFYVGLQTSPENVQRRAAAMEAIKSMLNRDMMESYVRSEAIMSILLEMKIRKEQKDMQDVLNSMR